MAAGIHPRLRSSNPAVPEQREVFIAVRGPEVAPAGCDVYAIVRNGIDTSNSGWSIVKAAADTLVDKDRRARLQSSVLVQIGSVDVRVAALIEDKVSVHDLWGHQ